MPSGVLETERNFSMGDEIGECFSELQEECLCLGLVSPVITLLFSSPSFYLFCVCVCLICY